ncbi:hypothetical protein BJX65DRAFT_100475 [Aspergillus insuetus]
MSSASTALVLSPASTTVLNPTSLTTKRMAACATCGNGRSPLTHKACLSSYVNDFKWDRAFWGKSWTEGSSASASSVEPTAEDKKGSKTDGKRPREGMMTEERFKEMEDARVEAVRKVKGE